jgi:hypothetical protein
VTVHAVFEASSSHAFHQASVEHRSLSPNKAGKERVLPARACRMDRLIMEVLVGSPEVHLPGSREGGVESGGNQCACGEVTVC